ncbi:unnamed protein product [Owenia fusiformis]|uniref:Uncharacterized protein n=1 Tax=Owenia fusiformis TaxID=6347 RepID=A0A8S4PTP8_OWEFU|nr:unnamed protein product [Owenia fusiformis]
MSSSVGITVTHSLKQRIWHHEFIELSKLLQDNNDSDEDNDVKVTMVYGEGKHVYMDWLKAFLIFTKIYLSVYPTEAGELTPYIALIQSLKTEGRMNQRCSWGGGFLTKLAIISHSTCPRAVLIQKPRKPLKRNGTTKVILVKRARVIGA